MHPGTHVEVRGEPTFFFYQVGSKDQAQVVLRLGSNCLYPLSHLLWPGLALLYYFKQALH